MSVDEALDKAWYKAMNNPRHLTRWKQACNVSHPSKIDYTVPLVELESQLCDIRKLKMIRKGKHRDEFLALLSPEAQDLYLNAVDGDGHRYTDLEDPSVLRSMIAGMKARWKKEHGTEMTPEMESALEGMIKDEDE